VEVLTACETGQEIKQMQEASPGMLQLVNDVADSIFLRNAEDFKTLVAEVLHSVCNPVDVTAFDIPDIAGSHRDKLQNFEQALARMTKEVGPGYVVTLTDAGRALVRYSKFRPVLDVDERIVKVYDGNVLKVSAAPLTQESLW
jgi:hypothetical protein